MENKTPGVKMIDLSEDELREMLDAREREKELARRQTGRLLTKILFGGGFLLAAAILCFPSSRKMIRSGAKEKPESAPAIANVPGEKLPGPSDIPDELKPFSIKPGGSNQQGDIHFAMELLQFMQPPAREPERKTEAIPPAPPTPATHAKQP